MIGKLYYLQSWITQKRLFTMDRVLLVYVMYHHYSCSLSDTILSSHCSTQVIVLSKAKL
jgi:hypothetical protein